VVGPGVRCAGEKEVRQNLKFKKFAQVDSVLSADGRRPVRHGQYNAKSCRARQFPV